MRYITSAERLGFKKGKGVGKEIGKEIASRELVQLQIEKKFGKIDSATEEKLKQSKEKSLKQIAINILTAENLEEVFS